MEKLKKFIDNKELKDKLNSQKHYNILQDLYNYSFEISDKYEKSIFKHP